MTRLSWNEIRLRAARFVDKWRYAAYEKGETQGFYNDFFEIFGIQRQSVARYDEHTRWIPKGKAGRPTASTKAKCHHVLSGSGSRLRTGPLRFQ